MTLSLSPGSAPSQVPARTARSSTPRQPSPAAPAGNHQVVQRNRRVEAYRALVRPLAIHYARCSPEPSEDLLQVGMLGLIRAAELYRSDRATPFEVFARPHIRGAILHYLRDVAPCVRLPRRQAELQGKLSRLRQHGQDHPHPGPGPEDLRRSLGVDPEQWRLLLQHRQMNRPAPLDAERLSSLAAPPRQEDPRAAAARTETLLAVLEPRQRWVVRQVVLAGWSYRKLAAEMQVSPMTVQRLLRRGLDRLRQHLDGDALSSGFPSGVPADPFASGSRAC
jgi:RNA polymerase sigma-B factor